MPKIEPRHVLVLVAGIVASAAIWWITEKFLDRNGPLFGIGDDKGLL